MRPRGPTARGPCLKLSVRLPFERLPLPGPSAGRAGPDGCLRTSLLRILLLLPPRPPLPPPLLLLLLACGCWAPRACRCSFALEALLAPLPLGRGRPGPESRPYEPLPLLLGPLPPGLVPAPWPCQPRPAPLNAGRPGLAAGPRPPLPLPPPGPPERPALEPCRPGDRPRPLLPAACLPGKAAPCFSACLLRRCLRAVV